MSVPRHEGKRILDTLDYADLIHSAIGDVATALEKVAETLAAIEKLLEKQQNLKN